MSKHAHHTRFQPGRSGNPAGRPPGSLNKLTILRNADMEERALDLAEHSYRLAREMLDGVHARAMAGRLRDCRFLLELCMPRRVAIDLADITDRQSVLDASTELLAATCRGEIAPADCAALQKLLMSHLRLIAQAERPARRPAARPAGPATAPDPREKQENTGAAVAPSAAAPAPPAAPVIGKKQENTGPAAPAPPVPAAGSAAAADPHAGCPRGAALFLPMADWLEATGMGDRLRATGRLPPAAAKAAA